MFATSSLPLRFCTQSSVCVLLGATVCLCANLPQPATANPDQEGIEFFERKIRPVLIRYCYECHSTAASEVKGNLYLDSRPALLQGGDTGPAVVPGDAAESLLISAIHHDSLEMPPDQPLAPAVIADFEQWVNMGAPDPRNHPPTAEEAAQLAWRSVFKMRSNWWSLKPLAKTKIPDGTVDAWSQHPIDRFVEAKLNEAGLKPNGPADSNTLQRRLSLVLTGLPPTPEQVRKFEQQLIRNPQTAIQNLLDRILSSPHYGERWARHWMDIVRFAETHGYEWNHEVRDAWRYRDYLIRAFNSDVAYDQLIREHIAGDLLEQPRIDTDRGVNQSIIGTAFWRFSELGHDNCVIFPEIRYDAIDNQIDTLTKAFQAITVSCARCHDHKLDAVSTADYYALVGILESSRQVIQTIDSRDRIAVQVRRLQELKNDLRRELAAVWLEATEQLPQILLTAVHSERTQEDPSTSAIVEIQKQLQQDKMEFDNPLLLLKRMSAADHRTISTVWQQVKKAYDSEARSRSEFNTRNFKIWETFSEDQPHAWRAMGLGLLNDTYRAGEFVITPDDEQIVKTVLPAGIFTHILSQRWNGTLQSPWIPTDYKYLSIQFLGGGLSMIRAVVDSCTLNEYAGGGNQYLDDVDLQWKRFPTSAGPSHRSFVELTTKTDNLRWPDRPGAAGTDDVAQLQSPHSWFGVTHAVLHNCEESPRLELSFLLPLFDQSNPENLTDVTRAYQAVCQEAINAWQVDRANDDQVRWIDWLLSIGLLPNSVNITPSIADLVQQYRDFESTLPEPRVVAGMADHGPGFDSPVLHRGDALDLGSPVPRRYLEVLAGPMHLTTEGSGRQELAKLIASADNPLTARVMVNRIWHHLFGMGIVPTTDDFGHVGDQPSHPELLDYLAHQFMQQGWSIKWLIRHIVTSRTFCQSNVPSAAANLQDPDNRLLHHYPVRRLDSEAIRDTFLAVSGRLDPSIYGPSIQPYRKKPKKHRKLDAGPLDGNGRRSLYLKITRMEGPRFLELFDLPNPIFTRGSRDRTNVPAQALALLNDPFLIDQSLHWSERIVTRQDQSPAAQVNHMFIKALGRVPSDEERSRMITLVKWLERSHGTESPNNSIRRNIWQDVAHTFFNMKELIYIR